MTYTIENKGTGIVMFRIFVPESLVLPFLSFIEQKSKENHAILKKSSSLPDDNYFINLSGLCSTHFESYISEGMNKSLAVSATLKKIKVLGFSNISYDNLTSILTKSGSFRPKLAVK